MLTLANKIPYPGDMDVRLPQKMNLDNAVMWARTLGGIKKNTPINLKAPPGFFITPAGMLLSCAALTGRKVYLPPEEMPKLSYARWMGWTKHLGVEEQAGAVDQGGTYLPIRKIVFDGEYRSRLLVEADKTARLVASWVIKRKVTKSQKKRLYKWLQYAFREILRNVPEHSGQNGLLRTAQVWPNSDYLEVAVYDPGQGFHSSFNRGGEFTSSSPEEAIDMAVKPGVTGAPPEAREDEVWGNSGFGLYVLHTLAMQNNGWFAVVSDGVATTYMSDSNNPAGTIKKTRRTPVKGTLVVWHVDFRRLAYNKIDETLEEIIGQGEKRAGRRASTVSRRTLN
jgi:hypothetical protein